MTSLNDAFGIASFISGHDFGEVNGESKGQGSRSTFLKPQQPLQPQQQPPPVQQQQQPQQQPQPQPEYETYPVLPPRKKNLWKLVSYSFMVLFAILIFSTVEFWLRDLVSSNDLTSHQELGIRLLLPILVFFIMWNF